MSSIEWSPCTMTAGLRIQQPTKIGCDFEGSFGVFLTKKELYTEPTVGIAKRKRVYISLHIGVAGQTPHPFYSLFYEFGTQSDSTPLLISLFLVLFCLPGLPIEDMGPEQFSHSSKRDHRLCVCQP